MYDVEVVQNFGESEANNARDERTEAPAEAAFDGGFFDEEYGWPNSAAVAPNSAAVEVGLRTFI